MKHRTQDSRSGPMKKPDRIITIGPLDFHQSSPYPLENSAKIADRKTSNIAPGSGRKDLP